ncbi:MFS transporter [Lacticaseibacillus casei]|jgi:sugar (glycoside-pentoside-hexuronide) transporter|uniref:MFS transporter n=1 Tax=Lacticaseibacillus huelsenbergensis TaxID=3035291 RepID=A0ABY8DMB9_9LACO|nr:MULTISPECIES: MFS transporter [Lacticaseibacillus]MDG3062796.1 MFS transporter [Lacticaseibacillus sp. BCRC 81376]QVI38611.1 MFS transporter [Lacticaseibacillus casei]QXG60339.1 MFS transporter [Lacticaseibacillus casei]WFB38110.1 MFS transporter [Lacticaseibacillus huelsenbergensis]WFB42512.1 MFS transporter [Lacticaseibacillus huelsenbergensis]
MQKKPTAQQTKWPERISYGLSDAADNLVFQVMTTYLLYFYTDIYGLSAGAVALLFLIARVADVFESPVVGLMIDHTHSRFGKSRPFFLWYALPYAVFAVLTFVTPNWSANGKLLWAYATYLLLGFLYTAVNLPITSVLPTLTQNQQELTLLGVIRQFFGSSVQIIVAVFTLPLVAFFGRGNDQHGFLLTMALFAGISLLLILNTFVHIRERFTQKKIAHQPFRVVAKIAVRNKPWLILSGVIFTYWLLTAIKNQTTVYYFKYTLHNQNLVSWANSFTFSSLIGVLLIISIAGHYGNKHTMRLGMLIGLAGQLVIAGGVYLRQLWLLFFGILVNSIGQGMIVGLVSIMLADTIRYGITLGAQAEGFFASSNDFGVNLGLGIGGLVTAGLFDLTGYVPNTSQNAATLGMIDLNYVWLPLLLYGILLLLIHFYPEKKMLTAIREHHL